MCGITASILLPTTSLSSAQDGQEDEGNKYVSLSHEQLRQQLQESIDLLKHRGPDENGTWVNDDASVGLAHCRLAIQDLSPAGCQPLHDEEGLVHAVVNGEIYDHDRLREECVSEHGYKFRGEGDSELVLALYKIHGAPGFLRHLRGEFAFVLYDGRKDSERVIAVRDRFGIKPMFWTITQGRLLLAAEIKAFLGMGWKPEWDVASILNEAWLMDRRTLFKGVRKLQPGHWLEITQQRGVEMHKYWQPEYNDKRKVDTRSLDEMILGVRERLVEAIRLRLRADVPVGIYLSGGIDSSAVAGIVTQLAREEGVKIGSEMVTRVACFSVEFSGKPGYDESDIADRTAKHLGVETFKRNVDEHVLAHNFADAVYHCEHHIHDLGPVAKFALSSLPQEHGFKVVLSGEGADEHFAGYAFFPAEALREPDQSQPDSSLATDDQLRTSMHKTLEAELKVLFQLNNVDQNAIDELSKEVNDSSMLMILQAWSPPSRIFSSWAIQEYGKGNIGRALIEGLSLEDRANIQSRWHPLHSALYMWNNTVLPNDLLSCLGDRMEMSHSIEGRTPFLDHVLCEYINDLPPSVKVRHFPDMNGLKIDGPMWEGSGKVRQSMLEKWILREAVRPYITQELYERRKHPFVAPSKWKMGAPVQQMLAGILTPEAVAQLGFINPAVVSEALGMAFGDDGDAASFRMLLAVSSWVVLGQTFGVPRAENLPSDHTQTSVNTGTS